MMRSQQLLLLWCDDGLSSLDEGQISETIRPVPSTTRGGRKNVLAIVVVFGSVAFMFPTTANVQNDNVNLEKISTNSA